jgi:hypothetical protein
VTAEPRPSHDWQEWHRAYEAPDSRLSRRLRVVQEQLRAAIDERAGAVRIISMCAGQGRDVIGVLAEHPRRDEIRALLVELNPELAADAEGAARAAGLEHVRAVCGDAAMTDQYAEFAPADIVLACGIFGNVTHEDIRRTIDHLPMLCGSGATVIWTRGGTSARDVALDVRRWFSERGFAELAYVSSPDEDHYRVGAHRMTAEPRTLAGGARMFTFRW